jgi:Citrate synthase, C-terminal domain
MTKKQVRKRQAWNKGLEVGKALLAMSERCGLSPEASFSLFALGRCIGWLAHAIEQAATGQLIRRRARYVGPALGDAFAAEFRASRITWPTKPFSSRRRSA